MDINISEGFFHAIEEGIIDAGTADAAMVIAGDAMPGMESGKNDVVRCAI